ncbi:MAG: serine/threonine protein kinase [Deltaproteobacteria bacterium]|nr:serine/threonine protein kinase [Deltaproteobacteria bacterium]
MAAPTSQRLRSAPQVLDGTWLAEESERAEAFVEQVAQSALRPEVWTGAFATNVWGGRYEMEGLLAEGGQGTTFFGTDLKTGAQVVVKFFDVGKTTDWKNVELFEREVATLKRLEHDRIPSFMEVIEEPENGTRALVMTRVDGEDLHQTLLNEGPLTEARLWRVLIDVTEVLSFVHQQGLVHRDLKPKNLIRQKDGEIHLVDFGGVGQADGQKGSTVVGTFGYMAPEQLYGTTTTASDLYALGATLLTLATGKEPENLPRKGLSIDVDKAAPHLSAPMRKLLGNLLTPEPEKRPQNATEVAQSLKDTYEESKAPAQAKQDAATSKEGKGRRKREEKEARKGKGRMHESAHTSAVFSDDELQQRQEDFDDGLSMVGGTLHMIIGILASVAGVVVGEVFLPILITLVAAFTQGETRQKLEKARVKVREGSKKFRRSMQLEAESGARSMNDVSQRMRDKEERRKKRRREKSEKGKARPRHSPRNRGRHR